MLSFNVGVELGQLAIIAAMFLLITIPLRRKADYRKIVVVTCRYCLLLMRLIG